MGAPGPAGVQGVQGPRGEQGLQGRKGDPGSFDFLMVMIAGTVFVKSLIKQHFRDESTFD